MSLIARNVVFGVNSSEGRDAFKSPWQGPKSIEGDRPVVTVSLLGCSTLRVLSHFVCWLGGFCCQKRCSTWVTINHVNPWCSKICLASTGHLAQSSISSTLGDYKPREFMMLENLPGINWTLGTKFNQFNGLVVSNVLLQNCRSAGYLGRIQTVKTAPFPLFVYVVSLPRALCNTEEFSLSLTGDLVKFKQFKRHSSYWSCCLQCSGCLQWWRILSLTGHLAEIKQFKSALFLPADCFVLLRLSAILKNSSQ